jgi:DNA ligase (NAD+)
VELAGSTISRATLHNADQVERQDIRIGDHVWLVKAGDVIPAIESSIPEKRTGVEKVFVMPSACPVCGGEVQRVDGEVALRCVNPACSAQLLRRVEHFASRNALDIRALGGTAISALVEQGWISDPLDLFSLSKERLESLEIAERKFGKNAGSVVKALDESRKMPLERWLFATGIPGVGTTVAADIAAEHVHMADLAGSPILKNVIDNDSLKGKDRKILPIKVEAAKAVLKFFDGEYGRRYLARLQELGIDPKSAPKAKIATDGPLVGAGCVLTGTLSRPRGEYAEMIRLAGGNVQGSVSSKTRYLIAGANTGAAKTSKARELGTEVIDEARLVELLGDIAKQGTAPEAQPEIQGNENSPSTSGVLEQGLLF